MKNPGGPCYGSYQVTLDGVKIVSGSRVPFAHCHSSNQAEYRALIEALIDVGQVINAQDYRIEVNSDSMLMVNQLLGTWKSRNGKLGQLRNTALGLLGLFKSHTVAWNPRKINVRLFGH
jgi:ribonuclease HI